MQRSKVNESVEHKLVANNDPVAWDGRDNIASAASIALATHHPSTTHQSPNPRFTLDGSDELEEHLSSTCEAVRDGVRTIIPDQVLEGLLLGGGYGRGEGGVLRTPEEHRPYNDLEFYVFVRGHALLMERKYGPLLKDLAARLTAAAQVETEFKLLTFDKLRRSGPTMFYYDLLMGHRWLIGDDTLLAGCQAHASASNIPQHEATRLLMNRCSGLLFSAERLQRRDFGPSEADFVGRNIAKASLAMGDVVLTAHGQYHWSCRERHRRLLPLGLPALAEVMPVITRHHAAGLEFKLHPICCTETRENLAARHAEICALARQVWLWLENMRLGTTFSRIVDYASSPEDKCPETSAVKNRLLHLRTFGLRAALLPRPSRYPRERLLRALSLLLWEPETPGNPILLAQVQGELGTKDRSFSGLVAAYENLWHRFN